MDKADNQEKPGKKGIALSVEAWTAIRDNMSEIEQAISKLDSSSSGVKKERGKSKLSKKQLSQDEVQEDDDDE